MLKDIAVQMLDAYADLQPEQQLEVLIRVWAKEEAAGHGTGKALLLSILAFEALGVPKDLITPESLVLAVSRLNELADRLKSPDDSTSH